MTKRQIAEWLSHLEYDAEVKVSLGGEEVDIQEATITVEVKRGADGMIEPGSPCLVLFPRKQRKRKKRRTGGQA